MSVVLGKNVILYAYYNGANTAIGCATNATLTVQTEVQETTTVDTGTNKSFKGRSNSWTIRLDGLFFLDTTFGITNLISLQLSLLPLTLSFEATDTAGNDITYSGSVVIENTEITGQDNSAAGFSANFMGSGELAVDNAPINSGGVNRYDYEATGTEYEFSAADLVNKDILAVFHDTDSYGISTSSASNQVAKYTAASGTIGFDFVLTAGSKVAVLYQ